MNEIKALLFLALVAVVLVLFLDDLFSDLADTDLESMDWRQGTDCSDEDVPIVDPDDRLDF